MPIHKIKKENLTEKVYQQIKEAIMSGRFLPGERVPIRRLAEGVGTSVTPVREALLRLVSYGILELKPAHPITIPVLTKKEYLENRTLRIVNEGLGAAEAARKITRAQLNRLIRINEAMIRAGKEGRFKEAIAKNFAFHLELCRAAQMPALLEIIEILWLRIGPSLNFLQAQDPSSRSGTRSNYHRQIIAALAAGDPEASRSAVEADLIQGGEPLLRYFEEQAQTSPKIIPSSRAHR
jgi:DNA-binding GntR family transcriptional regulator